MNPYKVRITVVKKTFNEDLIEAYTEGCAFKLDGKQNCCHALKIGQSFETTGHAPEGLPDWAWCDMQKYVMTLARGGNFLGCKPGIFITCCTDGFRPVFYKLERIEED